MAGMNHSGKTTFARQLENKVANLVVIENDVRREFAEKNYKKLWDIARSKLVKTFDDPDLKTYHLKTMMEYSIDEWLNTCLANCNTKKEFRKDIIRFIHELGASVLILYMNIEYDVLLKRAKIAYRTKNSNFYSGKTWTWETIRWNDSIVANLERMKNNFDVPTRDEADEFMEVTSENWEEMIERVVWLIKGKIN